MQVILAGGHGGIGSAIAQELRGHRIGYVERTDNSVGECDVLVLISGIGYFGPLEDATEEKINELTTINLTRHMKLARGVIGKWKERKHGHIIFICSNSAYTGIDGNQIYGATKAGLLGFARGLQAEARKFNIKVSAISPGTTDTKFWEGAGRDHRLLCRPVRPEEIGRAVNFCIECSSIVTEMTILQREKCS